MLKRSAPLIVLVALFAALFAGCGSSKTHPPAVGVPKALAHPASGALTGHPHGDTGSKPTATQVAAAKHTWHSARAGLPAAATPVAVAPSPTGPSTPAGGWHVALADGFAVPIGTGAGQDPFWFAKTNSHGCCGNGNETNTESPSAVHWSATNGLELRCEGLVCGGVSTPAFTYEVGRPERLVLEFDQKLPGPAPGEDPGAWSISTTRWPPEIDVPEVWMWPSGCPTNCTGGFVYHSTSGQREIYFDPIKLFGGATTAFTTFEKYTTEIVGNTVTSWIDGKLIGSFTETANTDTMNLIMTHALRESTASRQTCQCVRSVAVYEDNEHAGQYVHNGGIAPGTTIEGSEPPPPPPPTTETTPPPPPPPPAPEKPPAPTGVTASSISTSTSPGLGIKWTAVSGATSYKLYRAGNENIEGRKPGEQWGGALSGASAANHQLVTAGGWYCYRVAAINANGQSPFSAPACATA